MFTFNSINFNNTNEFVEFCNCVMNNDTHFTNYDYISIEIEKQYIVVNTWAWTLDGQEQFTYSYRVPVAPFVHVINLSINNNDLSLIASAIDKAQHEHCNIPFVINGCPVVVDGDGNIKAKGVLL